MMVNDPLGFGNLPTQQTGPGGVVVQPPPLVLGPPAPAPTSAPRVVDRQAYLQEQLDFQRSMREAAAKRKADLARAFASEEWRQKLGGAIQTGIGVGEQGLADRTLAEREVQRRRLADPGTPAYENLVAQQQRYGRPLTPTEEVEQGIRQPVGLTGLAAPAYRAARTEIPYADRVAELSGKAGELAGRTIVNLAGGLPVAVANALSPVKPEDVGGAVGKVVAESLIPTEVWMAALELVPGVGTVPDLIRMAKRGAPEALTALAKVADGETMQRFTRALADETGAATPEKIVPDSVRALLTKRGQKASTYQVVRKAKEPISEADLAARWAALPESTQKLIASMADVIPANAERKVIVGAGRARQIAKSQEAVLNTRGLPADERARAVAGALRGKIIPGVEPIRARFTQQEADEIYAVMDNAVDSKKILGVEYARAESAMNLLFHGERLPGFPGPDNLMPNEIKLLGRIYGPEFETVLPRTLEERSRWAQAIDILAMPRAIQSAIDFSAPGRQGIILGIRNPDYWFQAWKRQFQAAKSEEGFARVANEIRSDPDFEDAVKHGVDFTDIGGGEQAEEGFVSAHDWIQKGKYNPVAASGRAYTGFLDYLRVKSYGRGARRLRHTAEKHTWDTERLEAALDNWGHFTNVASGRGDLGALNKFTPALNALLFSPRFFVSRPQTVWQLVKPGQDPAVRQMVFENLGLVGALGTTLLATLKMTGAADVELNPQSTDFGKVRVGNQRIDFFAGFQPLIRYTAQIATRTRKDPYAKENVSAPAWTSIRRFIRSKLSPAGAVGWDFVIEGGKDYEGKEILGDNWQTNLSLYAIDRVAPIGLQDIHEGYQEAGIVGAAVGTLSLTGLSVQSYSPKEQQQAMADLEAAGINVTYVDDEATIRVPQLEKDWQSPKWHALFADDFNELGDTTRFEYVNNMREAYVDYWWDKKGDVSGVGEKQRRADIGAAFEKADSIKRWRDNEQAERLLEWERHPELLLEAVRTGLETLNKDERKILDDAGLLK